MLLILILLIFKCSCSLIIPTGSLLFQQDNSWFYDPYNSAPSPFVSSNNCIDNFLFVVDETKGAVCTNDTTIIKNSFKFMYSNRKKYEFVVYDSDIPLTTDEEYICKVNSTQYSDTKRIPLLANEHGIANGNITVPITCHVPPSNNNLLTDVEIWRYKYSTNTANRLKVVYSILQTNVWNSIVGHTLFSRTQKLAGSIQNTSASSLIWWDSVHNPCENCTRTNPHSLSFYNNAINHCNYEQSGYCSFNTTVNCTSDTGGVCYSEVFLAPPLPPPRLPPPAPSPGYWSFTYSPGINTFNTDNNIDINDLNYSSLSTKSIIYRLDSLEGRATFSCNGSHFSSSASGLLDVDRAYLLNSETYGTITFVFPYKIQNTLIPYSGGGKLRTFKVTRRVHIQDLVLSNMDNQTLIFWLDQDVYIWTSNGTHFRNLGSDERNYLNPNSGYILKSQVSGNLTY